MSAQRAEMIAQIVAIIGHAECDDPWFSCPLAEDGRIRDTIHMTMECVCDVEETATRIVDEVIVPWGKNLIDPMLNRLGLDPL